MHRVVQVVTMQHMFKARYITRYLLQHKYVYDNGKFILLNTHENTGIYFLSYGECKSEDDLITVARKRMGTINDYQELVPTVFPILYLDTIIDKSFDQVSKVVLRLLNSRSPTSPRIIAFNNIALFILRDCIVMIQNKWRNVIVNPKFKVCKRRLQWEFDNMI